MAYVYRHIRVDKNEPFYIGIGKTKYRHTAKQNRNCIWDKIVAKTEFEVDILFEDVTWEFACQKEIEFISLYGRINNETGILANMTNGGDGNLGLIHSKEAIEKIAESSRNRKGHWKGKKMSQEFKDKLSMAKKGKPISHLIGLPCTQKARDAVVKHSIGNKYHLGKRHTEESKRKMSEKMKGRVSHYRKAVIQYSLNGDFIMEYPFISEAQKVTGCGEISMVCLGKRKTCKGFIWKYKN